MKGCSWGGESWLGWKWALMTPGSLSTPMTVCGSHWNELKTWSVC